MSSDLGHKTRISLGSSVYDEICTLCGATDARGDKGLEQPCPEAEKGHSPAPVDAERQSLPIKCKHCNAELQTLPATIYCPVCDKAPAPAEGYNRDTVRELERKLEEEGGNTFVPFWTEKAPAPAEVESLSVQKRKHVQRGGKMSDFKPDAPAEEAEQGETGEECKQFVEWTTSIVEFDAWLRGISKEDLIGKSFHEGFRRAWQLRNAPLREQLAQAQFEVEALKSNAEDWRKAYADAQRERDEARASFDKWSKRLREIADRLWEKAAKEESGYLHAIAAAMEAKVALARSGGTKEGQ